MDKSWIKESNIGEQHYVDGVVNFINFVRDHGVAERITSAGEKRYVCPCRNCMNSRSMFHSLETIAVYLFTKGMMGTYTIWDNHGEISNMPTAEEWYRAAVHGGTLPHQFWASSSSTNPTESNPIRNMLHDTFVYHEPEIPRSPAHDNVVDMDIQSDVENYNILLSEAQRPLYLGSRVTLLETVIDAMNMKVTSKMSDATFNRVCDHIQSMLPEKKFIRLTLTKLRKSLRASGWGIRRLMRALLQRTRALV